MSPITTDEYVLLQSLTQKLSQRRDLVDDLTQEVALYWAELPAVKKKTLREKNLVKFWFIRVILNQDRSKTSKFYKYFKVRTEDHPTESLIATATEDEDEDLENDLELIQTWIQDLFISDRNIVQDYFVNKMTIMAISAKFGVDKNYVVATLDRVKRSFKRRLEWSKSPKGLTDVFVCLLAPMIGRARLKAEERQIVLDIYNWYFKTNYNCQFDKKLVFFVLDELVKTLKL